MLRLHLQIYFTKVFYNEVCWELELCKQKLSKSSLKWIEVRCRKHHDKVPWDRVKLYQQLKLFKVLMKKASFCFGNIRVSVEKANIWNTFWRSIYLSGETFFLPFPMTMNNKNSFFEQREREEKVGSLNENQVLAWFIHSLCTRSW